ncbi:hypothetical protein SAMN04488056_1245 [Cohaesibacter marisflavi]|uniref:Uncharacterized protein n=1 Tax=Cohaesibacter marisflavi TaxID=655353 RepID=A0A1I5MXP1_9HYPH|nr:hypothetical protein SAMN04488056_1245 [Cohaesibacter marisflavi]
MISYASNCLPLKSSFDFRFSFSAIALRIRCSFNKSEHLLTLVYQNKCPRPGSPSGDTFIHAKSIGVYIKPNNLGRPVVKIGK